MPLWRGEGRRVTSAEYHWVYCADCARSAPGQRRPHSPWAKPVIALPPPEGRCTSARGRRVWPWGFEDGPDTPPAPDGPHRRGSWDRPKALRDEASKNRADGTDWVPPGDQRSPSLTFGILAPCPGTDLSRKSSPVR